MKKPNTFTLLLLTAFASVAAVLYTPALPAITHFFAISTAKAQLTLILFLIAYALAPTLYGPLAHRFGRKPTLFLGMGIGFLGIVLCIISFYTQTFTLLVLGRFIEGFGSSVGLVIALTMVHDTYTGVKARKILSLTTLSFALLPGLAMFFAGVLIKHFAWVSTFYFTAIYFVAVMALSALLPETAPHNEHNNPTIKQMLHQYGLALKDVTLLGYTLMWACTTAFFYLFAALAPFIVINQFGISPEKYGLFTALSYLSLIAGNFSSAYLAAKFSGRQTILAGIILACAGAIVFMVCLLTQHLTVLTLYAAIVIAFYGMPFILANASALAAAHVPAERKAIASATMSFVNMGFAVIAMFIVTTFTLIPSIALGTAFLILMMLTLLLFMLTLKLKK